MEKSNQNPTASDDTFAFGPFELSAKQRRLTQNGTVVPLKPKTFDLLLLLVTRAGQLVGKEELRRALWADVHVEESNLTNSIAAIRRVLGRQAIYTSPKHGYCFDLPLTRRPGIPLEVVALFEEANGLFPLRSVEAMTKARNLYWICLAEAPQFADAWAWLGRCCRWLATLGNAGGEVSRLAEGAFRRALLIKPDLSCAHEFYSYLQVDQGQAIAAMVRLLEYGRRQPGEARTFAALTHVLRYCGLLAESVAAHQHAIRLRADLQTSVAHSLFNRCDFAGVIEAYGGPTQTTQRGYLDLAAWAALKHEDRAADLARKRLSSESLPPSVRVLLVSLLSALEGDGDKVTESLDGLSEDPENAFYHARHLCQCGQVERSMELLRDEVVHRSYGCAYALLNDPWFTELRRQASFRSLLDATLETEAQARAELRRVGGDQLLDS